MILDERRKKRETLFIYKPVDGRILTKIGIWFQQSLNKPNTTLKPYVDEGNSTFGKFARIVLCFLYKGLRTNLLGLYISKSLYAYCTVIYSISSLNLELCLKK